MIKPCDFFLDFFLYDVQVVARLLENVVAGRYSKKTTMYVRSCDCHMMHHPPATTDPSGSHFPVDFFSFKETEWD